MLSNRWAWCLVVITALGGAACDDGDDGDGREARTDAGGGDSGGGTSAACPDGHTVDPSSTPASADTGTVTGKFTYSGDPDVPAGRPAVGDLYISALSDFSASCPDPSAPPEAPLAQTVLRCVDLEPMGEVAYQLDGVPVGDEIYVLAFLDVDGNVDPSNAATAGPGSCDLLSGGVGDTVTVASADTPAELDVELNTSGGLIQMLCGYDACEPE